MTQIEYLDILFNDLGYNLAQKKDYLQSRYGVRYLDELPTQSLSRLIAELKEDKKDKEDERLDDSSFDPEND